MLKVISYYLPQFHSIPENDEVWGKGFTEWNSVKKAKPLYSNHNQPRIPLKDNYYNLLDENTLLWQTEIAKKNNVYGFCIYHYWFSGKLLLNKPVELIRNSNKIHFPYCICWANESWGNAWVSDKPKTFLEQKYGDKSEWREHFEYLLTFFKDPDYISENNKPLVVIYRPENIPNLNNRLEYWQELAKNAGFDGLTFAYQQKDFEDLKDKDDTKFTYSIEYQPRYALDDWKQKSQHIFKSKYFMKRAIQSIGTFVGIDILEKIRHKRSASVEKKGPNIFNFDEIANEVVQRTPNSSKSIAGMLVGYDDTPRKGNRGSVIQSTPDQFRNFLFKQAKNVKENYQNDYLFIFAWNEWGESGYLEPDTKYDYQYLHAIHDVVDEYDKL